MGGNRPERTPSHIAFFSPRTLSGERCPGATPSVAWWSLPAGVWLKGLFHLELRVAGEEQVLQPMGDLTGPGPHIPAGCRAGKTPRESFPTDRGLPRTDEGRAGLSQFLGSWIVFLAGSTGMG